MAQSLTLLQIEREDRSLVGLLVDDLVDQVVAIVAEFHRFLEAAGNA